MKLYVTAFAVTNRTARDYLVSKTPIVIDHLIKVFLHPKVQEQNHWKVEISSTLNSVPMLKINKKRPSTEFIYSNTFDAWKETIKDRIDSITEDMKEYPISYTIDDIYHAIEDYFLWISSKLASGVLRPSEIYNEIENLRNQYFNN